MNILAIDPGNELSAYCIIDADTYRPVEFDKIPNEIMLKRLDGRGFLAQECVIERIASYGMAVGQTVHDTSWWSGVFWHAARHLGVYTEMMFRREVKLDLCHVASAKDANVIQALIDRFDPYASNRGKGTKKEPGWFYGFKADVWQAYALGVTYLDRKGEEIWQTKR